MSIDPNKVIYSMIGVSKFYQKKPILKDIYLSYFYGAKIGVLGLNGSGKSTLLRILAGVDTEFNGKTILTPGHTIGYLEQEPQLDPARTVREIVEQGVQSTVDLLKEYNEINEKFAEPISDDDMNKLIERQGEVQESLDHLDAWDLDSRLEMAMDALRCPPGDTLVKVCPAGKNDGWRFAGFCCKNPTSCCWMSPPTIWMPNPSPGWNTIFRITPGPSLPSPMTGIFWTMWPAGFWNWTGARAFPGKAIILPGWIRNTSASKTRKNPNPNARKPSSGNWNGSA